MPRKLSVGPVVALAGVVVDDIENHLDPGRVQRLHHALELAERSARRIAHVGGEEANRVVAPVVAQAVVQKPPLVDDGVDRQQLDRGDAQILQVGKTAECKPA